MSIPNGIQPIFLGYDDEVTTFTGSVEIEGNLTVDGNETIKGTLYGRGAVFSAPIYAPSFVPSGGGPSGPGAFTTLSSTSTTTLGTSNASVTTSHNTLDDGTTGAFTSQGFTQLGLTDGRVVTKNNVLDDSAGAMTVNGAFTSQGFTQLGLTDGRVVTKNNVLDDGSGDATFANMVTIKSGHGVVLNNAGNTFGSTIEASTLTANRVLLVPDASGTIALSGGAGSFTTLTSTGATSLATSSGTVVTKFNTLDNGSGIVTINDQTNNASTTSLSVLAPNIGAHLTQLTVGTSNSTRNAAVLSYTNVSAGSTSNSLNLAIVGSTGITINGSGVVSTANNTLDNGSGASSFVSVTSTSEIINATVNNPFTINDTRTASTTMVNLNSSATTSATANLILGNTSTLTTANNYAYIGWNNVGGSGSTSNTVQFGINNAAANSSIGLQCAGTGVNTISGGTASLPAVYVVGPFVGISPTPGNGQLVVSDSANGIGSDQELWLGADHTAHTSFIQSFHQGSGVSNLNLNINGGNVNIAGNGGDLITNNAPHVGISFLPNCYYANITAAGGTCTLTAGGVARGMTLASNTISINTATLANSQYFRVRVTFTAVATLGTSYTLSLVGTNTTWINTGVTNPQFVGNPTVTGNYTLTGEAVFHPTVGITTTTIQCSTTGYATGSQAGLIYIEQIV